MKFFGNRLLPAALAFVTITGISFLAFLFLHPVHNLSLAEELQRCSSSTSSNDALLSCAREKIVQLLQTHTTKELMAEDEAGPLPVDFHGCHSVGHLIGQATYAKTGTLEGALAACSNICSYACIHGAVGAAVLHDLGQEYADEDIQHASTKEILQIASKYCTSKPLCHAVGHLLFMTMQNLSDALSGCDKVAKDEYQESCYQGVFMQYAGGLGDSIISSTTVPTSHSAESGDYAYPCDTVPAPYAHACFQYIGEYQISLFGKENVSDPEQRLTIAAHTCEKFSGSTRADCFEGIGRDMGDVNRGYTFPALMSNFMLGCAMFEGSDAEACVLGTVSQFARFQEFTDATHYCSTLTNAPLQNICWNVVFQFVERGEAGTVTVDDVCIKAENETTCKSKYATYTQVQAHLPNYALGLNDSSQ